jgi:hypothetical protein
MSIDFKGEAVLGVFFWVDVANFQVMLYIGTSRLPVRCDGLQQYPRKLSIKKISTRPMK